MEKLLQTPPPPFQWGDLSALMSTTPQTEKSALRPTSKMNIGIHIHVRSKVRETNIFLRTSFGMGQASHHYRPSSEKFVTRSETSVSTLGIQDLSQSSTDLSQNKPWSQFHPDHVLPPCHHWVILLQHGAGDWYQGCPEGLSVHIRSRTPSHGFCCPRWKIRASHHHFVY